MPSADEITSETPLLELRLCTGVMLLEKDRYCSVSISFVKADRRMQQIDDQQRITVKGVYIT